MGFGVCITHLLARISSDVMSGVLVSFAIQDTLSAMALVGLYLALFCSRSPLGQQLLCLASRLNSSHAYTDLLDMHALGVDVGSGSRISGHVSGFRAVTAVLIIR